MSSNREDPIYRRRRKETVVAPAVGAGAAALGRDAEPRSGQYPSDSPLRAAATLPRRLLIAACAALLAPMLSTHAQPAHSESNAATVVHSSSTSTIGPALQRSTGVVTVNQTAGDGNVQQNSAALAASEGHSVAAVDAQQTLQQVVPTLNQLLNADISSGAFDDALGVYLVNQSAGGGNSQFNGAAIAVGGISALAIVQLDDALLREQSVGSAAPVLPEEGGAQVSASANLAPDAFAGARGLFLVNQAAGNNNATANTFTLSAPP